VSDPSLVRFRAVVEGALAAIAYADVSTGELACCALPAANVAVEIERLAPAEIVLPRGATLPVEGAARTERDDWQFDLDTARDCLLRHFEVGTLEGFGCADLPLAVRAAGGPRAATGRAGPPRLPTARGPT